MKQKRFESVLKENKHEVIMLVMTAVFYLSLFAVYGVELCDDSRGYINMISAREPVYPLFLALNRVIFGENVYLGVVVFIQNLLMIYAVWSISVYLYKRLKLSPVIGYLMILANFGVACLCQFIALRGSVYSNSIETEGIAIPLWIIFMRLLFQAIDTADIKYVWYMSLLTTVMMDVRKQMMAGFPVLFAVLFFAWLKKEKYLKKMIITIIAIVISFVLALGITRVYNYCLRGSFAQNTRDMNLVLTTSLYVADAEDADLIEEEEARKLFVRTMEILEEEKITHKFAGNSLAELNAHYGDSFDKITIDTTAYLFVDYAIENGFKEGMEAEAEADRMSSVIVNSLLADNIGTYIKVYISSVYDGLINTVAKRHRLLDAASMCMYIIYIALMIVCLLNEKTRLTGLFAMAVLFAILVNVCATALVIFCQTRYMIYNMSLFYMMGLAMVYALVRKRRL